MTLHEVVRQARELGLSTTEAAAKWPQFDQVEILAHSALWGIRLKGSPESQFERLKNMVDMIRHRDKSNAQIAAITGYTPAYVSTIAHHLAIELPDAERGQVTAIKTAMAAGVKFPVAPAAPAMKDEPPAIVVPPAVDPHPTIQAPIPLTVVGPAIAKPDISEFKDDYDVIRQGLEMLYEKLDSQLCDRANDLATRRAIIAKMMRVESVRNSLTQ